MEPNLATSNKNKNKFDFKLSSSQKIVEFTSDFDSGNLGNVQQINQFEYKIRGRSDQINQKAKYWFNFEVIGFPVGSKVKLIFTSINIITKFYNPELKQNKSWKTQYQICYKYEQEDWKRTMEPTKLQMNNSNQLQLTMIHTFKHQKIQFAFCYPYSFEQLDQYLTKVFWQYKNDNEIAYNQETLTYTHQNRAVKLITINSKNNLSNNYQEYLSDQLFPERKNERRPLKPLLKKNYILITGRVHPAESPSSYAIEGIINFLLNKRDLRSSILRQIFTILIIPMLNPDGVYNGNFRTDTQDQNLNRYYHMQQNQNQKEIYAVKRLISTLESQKRLMYYFDLHAHNSPKGCFIYGNFINEFHKQIESKVFCKIMEINENSFEYLISNFSKKNMKAKDKTDKYSKEGCGRVYVFKKTDICHSFTVQLGYYKYEPKLRIQESNKQFVFQHYCFSPQSSRKMEYTFSIQKYKEIGKNLMISILDTLELNPYSKIQNSEYKKIEFLRKRIAYEVFQEEQRFKNQVNVYNKIKNINSLVEDIYMDFRNRIIIQKYLYDKQIKWPSCIKFNYYLLQNKLFKHIKSEGNSRLIKFDNNFKQKQKLTKIETPKLKNNNLVRANTEEKQEFKYNNNIKTISPEKLTKDKLVQIHFQKSSVKSDIDYIKQQLKKKKVDKKCIEYQTIYNNSEVKTKEMKTQSTSNINHFNVLSFKVNNSDKFFINKNTQKIQRQNELFIPKQITKQFVFNQKANHLTLKLPKLQILKVFKIKLSNQDTENDYVGEMMINN